MDKCAINFIARHWWRRVEVWLIAILLLSGGAMLGFQVAQWSLAGWYSAQVSEVRRGYDEATKQRDLRLTKLADKTTDAASKVEAASASAVHAADTASKAADKVNEAVERQSP
jgi:predicted negative regulator of RcsB-dependent stress response